MTLDSPEYKKAKEKAIQDHMIQRADMLEDSVVKIFSLHTKALACHCECLGMNAENSLAVCQDRVVPYSVNDYLVVMMKWGLINENNESI